MIGPLWLCFSQEVLHRSLIKPETCFLYINTSAEQDWHKNKTKKKNETKQQDQCAKVSGPNVKVTILERAEQPHTQDHHTLWFMQSWRKSCSALEHRLDKRVQRLTEIRTDVVTEGGTRQQEKKKKEKKGSFSPKQTSGVDEYAVSCTRPYTFRRIRRLPSSWLGEYQTVNAGVVHGESTFESARVRVCDWGALRGGDGIAFSLQ